MLSTLGPNKVKGHCSYCVECSNLCNLTEPATAGVCTLHQPNNVPDLGTNYNCLLNMCCNLTLL